MASAITYERTLRKITIATLLPAFSLLVASGVTNSHYYYHANPTIIFFGLIPTFFSAITSALALNTKHDPLDKRPQWCTFLWFAIDTFLALANLVVLIFVWAFDTALMRGYSDWMMLETYATVFLMSNM